MPIQIGQGSALQRLNIAASDFLFDLISAVAYIQIVMIAQELNPSMCGARGPVETL
jgi:hypothetical protein